MSRLSDHLFAIAAALWVGALWAIGSIVAPILFQSIPDKRLFGDIVAQLFYVLAWLGIACASYMLIVFLVRDGFRSLKTAVFWLVFVMLLLTLAAHFGVQPIIAGLRHELAKEAVEAVVRQRFATWHGIASVLYIVQSALGIGLLTQLFNRP